MYYIITATKIFFTKNFTKFGAVTLRMRYTKYSDNSITNLLYLVVLLLIATAHLILSFSIYLAKFFILTSYVSDKPLFLAVTVTFTVPTAFVFISPTCDIVIRSSLSTS